MKFLLCGLVTMSQVALADEKKKEHIKVELEHLASVQMEGWLLIYLTRCL